MNQQIEAKPAVLRATIQVKRAATGQIDTYELIGTPIPETKEPQHGSDTPDSRS